MAWHFGASDGWANPRYDCDSCRKRAGSRVRPDRPNCPKYFPQDVDTLSKDAWWTPTYKTDDGKHYYPKFEWPECPVATLTRGGDFDAMGLIQIVSEARTVGGKGAVWAVCKRDARMFDAAAVIEHCSGAERIARMKAR